MSNKDDGWTTVENKKRPKGKKKSSQTSSNSSNSNVGTNTDYADWTPVVLSGSRNKKKKAQGTGPTTHTIKYNAGTNKQSGSTNIAKIEADIEEGKHLKNVSKNLQKSIQSGRQGKNWTQKQLAQECNLPLNVIKSYENGTAIYDSKHVQVMSQKLGVSLKKN